MVDYLNAIVATMDADGVMASGREVAESAGMSPEVANSYRTRLKNMGIVRDPGKGRLVFTIPYIPFGASRHGRTSASNYMKFGNIV